MPGLHPWRAWQVARVIARQRCNELPGEPYADETDSSQWCIRICDHVLVGLDHINANGTVW